MTGIPTRFSRASCFSALLLLAHPAHGAWTLVTSPNGEGRISALNAVAATSTNDIWAVGLTTPADSGAPQTLIEHWDGLSWSIVPSPNRPGRDAQNVLQGVTAVASDDAWAVGYSVDLDSPTIYSTLTLHWDGVSWSIVPSPNLERAPHAYNALLGVSAVASDDIWAVGGTPVNDSGRAIFMHWDGGGWSLFPAPPEMMFWFDSSRVGVAAIAPDDAWSIGLLTARTGTALVGALSAVPRATRPSPRQVRRPSRQLDPTPPTTRVSFSGLSRWQLDGRATVG